MTATCTDINYTCMCMVCSTRLHLFMHLLHTVSVHNNKHDYAAPKQSQGLAPLCRVLSPSRLEMEAERQKQD